MQIIYKKKSRKSPYILVWFCLLVLGLTLVGTVQGQETYKTLPSKELGKLTDLIFPKRSKALTYAYEYVVDISIFPSFFPPRHYTITKHRDEHIEIISYSLPKAKSSLGYEVDDLLKKGIKPVAEELVKHIEVKITKIENADFLQSAIAAFPDKILLIPGDSITLHGVGFKVYYADSETELEMLLIGGEKFHKNEHKLITWIRELENELAKKDKN